MPTQSFLARSKYDGAPGPPGATLACAAVAAIAVPASAGDVTRTPAARTAAPAINAVRRYLRTTTRPPIVPPSQKGHAEQTGTAAGGLGHASRATSMAKPAARASGVSMS